MLPLRPGTSKAPSPSFVVVHRSGLFDALSALFETLWRLALPLSSPVSNSSRQAPVLDADEQRILALMNSGLSDEAIARQLGLSQRTLQRRVRALMDRFHAVTRYQLGVQAARRLDAGPPANRAVETS